MKGIRTYLGLALLLSVAVAPNAFSMEGNLYPEMNQASTDVAEVITPVVGEAVKQVQDLTPGMSRYEQFKAFASDMRPSWNPRGWGQKFGAGLSASAASAKGWAKENLNKESVRNFADQAKEWGVATKDAIRKAPYKAIANGALEYTKTQAAANKPLLIGGSLAVAYQTGALNFAAKPVVYAAKGVTTGAQKVYTAAKNHKLVASGLGSAALLHTLGLGYYFKDALANAAQLGLSYVQPAMTTVLENKSDITKAAGATLFGIAAIEGVRAGYKMGKQYFARKAVLNRLKEAIYNDLNALATDTAKTSEFFQARIKFAEKALFTPEELKDIEGVKKEFNAEFNKARFLTGSERESALLKLKNQSINFGI